MFSFKKLKHEPQNHLSDVTIVTISQFSHNTYQDTTTFYSFSF
jgi:hypothetical protein